MLPQTQVRVRLHRQMQQQEQPGELRRRPGQQQQQRFTLVPWQRLPVWLAFDGLPPPDEAQEILSGNKGIWPPTVDAEANRLQRACQRVQADGSADRWARRPQLVLPVVEALKNLGVAQGIGRPEKELQAARAKTAFSMLQLVARLGIPRKALGALAWQPAVAC